MACDDFDGVGGFPITWLFQNRDRLSPHCISFGYQCQQNDATYVPFALHSLDLLRFRAVVDYDISACTFCIQRTFITECALFALGDLLWTNPELINPISAPAGKISGLKSAHIHTCKQYSTFDDRITNLNTVNFDRNLIWMLMLNGRKSLMISNLALLLVVFRVAAREAWQWRG